jgi:hypothetical protein
VARFANFLGWIWPHNLLEKLGRFLDYYQNYSTFLFHFTVFLIYLATYAPLSFKEGILKSHL